MATVNYGGYALIPAPQVAIVDEPILAQNQTRIGTTYKLTINGTLVNYKGSPRADTTASVGWGGIGNQFWTSAGYPPDETNLTLSQHQLYQIQSKQAALQSLFSQDGLWLEFTSQDGSTPFRCQPKNAVITFEAGVWFQLCNYTITLDADVVYLNGAILQGIGYSDLIQSTSESWDLQPADVPGTFTASHAANAVGKKAFDSVGNQTKSAWEVAKDYVNSKLTLGWVGASAFSALPGQTIFQQSSLASGVINLSTLSAYNFSRTEQVDEIQGSYGVVESWTLARGSGTDIYQINVKHITDEPYTTALATIQGTMKGFYTSLFDYDTRLFAAEWMLKEAQTNNTFFSRVSNVDSGRNYNLLPTQGSLDYNQQDGSITYQYEYCNKLYQGEALDVFTVARKNSIDEYKTNYSIQGSIRGRKYDSDLSTTGSFQRAFTWWTALNNTSTLYHRVISSEYFPEAASLGVQPTPINLSVDMDESNGVINYSAEYTNRRNDSDNNNDTVEETYQLSNNFSRQDGIITYNINGTVRGLSISGANPKLDRYNAAAAYFAAYTQPNLLTRVTNYYSVTLPNTNPQDIEIQRNPTEGSVTYNYGFKNIPATLIPGVLSETITISERNWVGQLNTTAKIPIIGRAAGVLIQDMQTTDLKTRTVNIETVLGPTGAATLALSFALKPDYSSFLDGIKPTNAYVDDANSSFDLHFGRYSQNITWIYN